MQQNGIHHVLAHDRHTKISGDSTVNILTLQYHQLLTQKYSLSAETPMCQT